MKIGYIIGSLAKDSINRKLAAAYVKLVPEGVEMVEIPVADLPLFNRDFDTDPGAEVEAFRDAVRGVDGLILITPEHNRSFAAALHNALEWGSRPRKENVFTGKPMATAGTSGGLGTAAGQQGLRSMLLHFNAQVMGQPEAYIQWQDEMISDDGDVADDRTKKRLTTYIETFCAFVGDRVE